jgi:hypothetical protein
MLKTATTFVAILSATAAFAQDETARRQALEVAARVPLERASKGAPYSAETVIESSQTLADGNRISTKTTGRVYRDGEGRTRRESDNKERTTISIVDPVAGYSYSLDTVNKIAWRTATGASNAIMGKLEETRVVNGRRLEPVTAPDGSTAMAAKIEAEKVQVEQAARAARVAGAQDAQSRAATTEQERVAVARGGGGGAVVSGALMPAGRGGAVSAAPLEHKMIDGIPVEGRKTTTVIPAGQIGNEQPITITSEEWRSPDLNVLVQTRHADPRTGESTYRLTNIIRAEPDPSLFMVPADYTVRDTNIRRMLEASQRK